ncbi:hypothetical protein LZZ85_26115 [Terrimonas sp. NA20]|uniref:Anti-sigma factor n=1 Tax=Terrimonas ginsenosidimutans TaxID=2908004 RepID=A0ABS9KZV2_9BACT|nr:hypothetical protein [Terrimonas ginsenosidimutans]MCG2617803.1 hypothetical protein [Terrimonas ginsenosidimutans]
MSRSLKDFIAENRHSFDDEQPGEQNWERIANAVPALSGKRSAVRAMLRWSVAAAVVIIIGGAYFFVQNKKAREVAVETRSNDIRILAPEYAASAEPIYQAIEQQQRELKDFSGTQPELYDQFTQDLATLDSSYRVLKAQASRSPNREILIKAMMNNLQLQAELLSRQLNILSEYNKTKPVDHAKEKESRRI